MLHRRRTGLLFLLTLALFSASHVTFAGPYSGLRFFGDSLSDNGNLFAATNFPPPPYNGGRFSNGLVYSEFLYANLGFGQLQPSLVGGDNFSWAGARTAIDIPLGSSGAFIPSVQTQVTGYLADRSGVADAGALHVVFAGSNDVADIVDLGLDDATNRALVHGTVADLLSAIDALISATAEQILVPNIPDLGLTPRFLSQSSIATSLSAEFNQALMLGLSARPSVLGFDTFALMPEIIATFSQQTSPCFDGSTVCSNAENYAFFDDFHPSEAFARQYAQALGSAVVPVVNTFLLMGLGLGLIFLPRARALRGNLKTPR